MPEQPVIEIYHAEICDLCHKARDYFRSRNLETREFEVEWDNEDWVDSPNVRTMLERAGPVDFVPQLFINGHHVSGWRQLEPLIQSGEIENLLFGPSPGAPA